MKIFILCLVLFTAFVIGSVIILEESLRLDDKAMKWNDEVRE